MSVGGGKDRAVAIPSQIRHCGIDINECLSSIGIIPLQVFFIFSDNR